MGQSSWEVRRNRLLLFDTEGKGGGMVSSHKMALARLDDSHSRRGLPVTTPVAPHH